MRMRTCTCTHIYDPSWLSSALKTLHNDPSLPQSHWNCIYISPRSSLFGLSKTLIYLSFLSFSLDGYLPTLIVTTYSSPSPSLLSWSRSHSPKLGNEDPSIFSAMCCIFFSFSSAFSPTHSNYCRAWHEYTFFLPWSKVVTRNLYNKSCLLQGCQELQCP